MSEEHGIKLLIEQLKRRVETATEEIKHIDPKDNSQHDKRLRLETKRGCYKTFITELERL